ncbi:MAG: major capsid protein [Plesiomonas shigelloides]
MTLAIYDTAKLVKTTYDLPTRHYFWLDTFFTQQINSDSEEIAFEKVMRDRKLAPFVAPMVQGKPVYREGSKMEFIKPAYIKLKDAVTPSKLIKRRAGEAFHGSVSPETRYKAIVGAIQLEHKNRIMDRWEWMGCQAALYGKVVIAGDDYPEVTVDFGRAANQTITKTAGQRWGEAGVSVLDDIETWSALAQNAPFGGTPTMIVLGTKAWQAFRKDEALMKLMDKNIDRPERTLIDIGPIGGEKVQRVGRLNGRWDVVVYADNYVNEAGATVPFMPAEGVFMSSPTALEGTRCFGAILDLGAQLRSLEIFPKMWTNEDPSATYIMNQSAPLMVPGAPNASVYATVVA